MVTCNDAWLDIPAGTHVIFSDSDEIFIKVANSDGDPADSYRVVNMHTGVLDHVTSLMVIHEPYLNQFMRW